MDKSENGIGSASGRQETETETEALRQLNNDGKSGEAKAKKNPVVVKNGTSSMAMAEQQTEKEHRYGWSKHCSPDSIQCLKNKKVFLVIFCLTCVVQGMFSTYFVAVITTLEKLLSIHSSTIGTLLAAVEIGQVSSSLLLPYFVGNGHRPRWIGIGAALFSIATLMVASPHVLLPIPSQFQLHHQKISQNTTNPLELHNSTYYCSSSSSTVDLLGVNGTNTTDTCQQLLANAESTGSGSGENGSKNFIFAVFFLSLLTIGLGQTAVYTLGIPYLDDNVTNRDSPLYFSITIGVKILGPVLGFVLGSLCTRLYIYPNIDPGFGTNHIHWLGAWWLGMVLISVLLFTTSIFMFGFPAKLTNTSTAAAKLAHAEASVALASAHAPASSPPAANKQPARNLKNFPVAIKRLLLNRMLLLRMFSSVFHLLPINGLYTFLPKYLENQFRKAAHEANMITAIAGILVMGIGIFGSGIYIRKYGPNAKAIARWIAICALVYSLGMFLLTMVGCDDPGFVDSAFGQPTCDTRDCNNCSESTYSPVCGIDGKTYFSPCYAGCPTQYKFDNSSSSAKMLQDCSCIEGGIATEEFCKPQCVSNINIYLIIFVSIVLVHSTSEVGSMLLTLRCVEPRDKAMALGLIQASIGIFGNVPCPIIYGTIVDYTCILWGKIPCVADHGHCWVYDSKLFRRLFHGTTGSLMFIAFLIDIIVYIKADSINLDDSPPPPAEILTVTGQRLSIASLKQNQNENENNLTPETIPMLDFSKDSLK